MFTFCQSMHGRAGPVGRHARTALAAAVFAALAWPAAPAAAETLGDIKREIEALKKRIEAAEKRAEEATKQAEAATKQAEGASEWKNALSHAHLAGYGAVTYTGTEQPGVSDSFTGVTFNPIFHYEFHDKVMLESELELEAKSDGTTETKLEYLAVDVFLNDYAMLVAGKFLSPLGQFRQNIHPAWINKLASAPPGFGHDGAAPEADVGLQLRGGWPMGVARGNYAVYVANGPEVEAEDGALEGIMSGGFTRDSDNKKVVGARVGFLPVPKVELGVSGATGKTSVTKNDGSAVTGEPARDYDVLGADLNWLVGDFRFLAEYVKSKVGAAATSTAPLGATWKAWYAQGSYLIPGTKWEAALRYTDFDSPMLNMDQKQTAVGVNYLFGPQVMAKLTFESNDGKVANSAADSDRWLAQIAYGF